MDFSVKPELDFWGRFRYIGRGSGEGVGEGGALVCSVRQTVLLGKVAVDCVGTIAKKCVRGKN